jgi:predicted dehydrogenase
MSAKKLKMGMIGGGPGSFIGAIHRIAASIDGEIELVCGVFSSQAEKSKAAGESLYLPASRIYTSYQELFEKEKVLPEGERMDFVSIVTPNYLHFEPARLALANGFHVMLDKPMTLSLPEARELKKLIEESGLLFCLTHTYTGYPMVKQARQMVQAGTFGKIRKVYVEYPQGWLSTALEAEDNKQASWRTDPAKSGKAGCMADIGTHAFNLAEYVAGQEVSELCADLHTVVEGRRLDDDSAVLLRFNKGASGELFATQVAAGEENNVKVRVYGEKGGLEWKQEEANTLLVKWPDKPTEIYRAGNPYLNSFATHNARTPAGHPEGYLEAFANHYRNFALSLQARKAGKAPEPEWLDFPDAEDGLRGMAFIENVVKSSNSEQKWISFEC